MLGDVYYKGIGVTKNLEEAFQWYKKAADQGDVGAQLMLNLNWE
jgi:TPR repeat protein